MTDNRALIQALLMGGYPEGSKIPGNNPPYIPDEKNFVQDPLLPQGTIFNDPLNAYDPMEELRFYHQNRKNLGLPL